MDEVLKLLDIAARLNLPGVVADIVGGIQTIKDAAAKAKHTLSDADVAELDRIHEAALAANAELDAKLAAAEKR